MSLSLGILQNQVLDCLDTTAAVAPLRDFTDCRPFWNSTSEIIAWAGCSASQSSRWLWLDIRCCTFSQESGPLLAYDLLAVPLIWYAHGCRVTRACADLLVFSPFPGYLLMLLPAPGLVSP